MPGIKLSSSERNLIDKWKIKSAYQLPRLLNLSISSTGNGLRGIKNLSVNLDRPITVICGQSGSGKSTILALSRLAFQHGITTNFDDLFMEVNNNQPFNDFSATWVYSQSTPETIVFDSATRKHSAAIPARPVCYIGLSRIVPVWEKEQMVNHFRGASVWQQENPLDEKHLVRLKDTLNKNYSDAGFNVSGGYTIRTCSADQTYTSFNMSSGEEILIETYRLLQAAPNESLVVIEDAEIGLNPIVMPKFARHLVDICLEKRIQIIITTHSLDFIVAFPSEFICLIKSDGNQKHTSTDAPQMQDIMASISSQMEQDIIVFCEDDVAENLIRQAVSGDLRRRLRMVKGSKTKLLAYAEAHVRAGWPQILLVIWDGDVKDKEVDSWFKEIDIEIRNQILQKVSFIRLPGPKAPEQWIVAQLMNDEGIEELAKELNEDPMNTRTQISMLNTMAEFHSISYELAQKTGLDTQSVLSSLIKTVSRLSTKPLETLKTQLERIANKEIISEFAKVEPQ